MSLSGQLNSECSSALLVNSCVLTQKRSVVQMNLIQATRIFWNMLMLQNTNSFAHTHTSPVLSVTTKSGKVALLRLEGASKAQSSSIAGVSVNGSLLSLHLCTASSPLLQNHFWHLQHCKTLLCSFTGFALSAKHLCLFLSLVLWKVTLLALHSHILCLHRCSSHPGSLSHW